MNVMNKTIRQRIMETDLYSRAGNNLQQYLSGPGMFRQFMLEAFRKFQAGWTYEEWEKDSVSGGTVKKLAKEIFDNYKKEKDGGEKVDGHG